MKETRSGITAYKRTNHFSYPELVQSSPCHVILFFNAHFNSILQYRPMFCICYLFHNALIISEHVLSNAKMNK